MVNRYPLIELRLFRDNCGPIVTGMGWPDPPRSSCWMCPNMADLEWQDMKENQPEDFARAAQFQDEIQRKDSGLFLHEERKPLTQIEFTNRAQNTLFCDSGYCFV